MQGIELSAAYWCLARGHTPAEVVFERLAGAGYLAIEMAEERGWPSARAAGLVVHNVGAPGMTEGLNHPAHQQRLVGEIEKLIAHLAANGVRNLIVFSGNRYGESDEVGRGSLVAGLRRLAPVAEAAGVTLLLELLNSVDHVGYQCDSSAYAFSAVKEVGSPAVKVLFDVYHSHRMGENPLAEIRANLPYIGHLHLAGSPKRNFPGSGQAIDYARLIPAVLEAGYGGYWGVEFCGGGDVLEEYVRAAELLRGLATGKR